MTRARRKKQKKEFLTAWVFETFDGDRSFCVKPMFGCLAAYVQGRMVMVLAEDPGDKRYRGKNYPFEIWNGILLPTEKCFHKSLIEEFNGLIPHPVLGKWLYLGAAREDFESVARLIGGRIRQCDPRLGIDPKIKLPRRQ